MSRTYRKYDTFKLYSNGIFYSYDDLDDIDYSDYEGWQYVTIFERQRDGKPYYKPSKAFKNPRRRKERAEYKDAMRKGKSIPIIKKSDQWDWN